MLEVGWSFILMVHGLPWGLVIVIGMVLIQFFIDFISKLT